MKVSRTVISSLLIGCALLSFTACSPKYDLSPKALADYVDDQGADEADSPYEFFNYNNSDVGDYMIYVYGDPEDFDGFESVIGYDERADEITQCMMQDGEVYAYIYSISFDQDDASDYYKEQVAYYEYHSSDAYYVNVTESSNLEYILYATSESDFIAVYHDCSTNSVLSMGFRGGDEDDVKEIADEICKDFGVVSPSIFFNED